MTSAAQGIVPAGEINECAASLAGEKHEASEVECPWVSSHDQIRSLRVSLVLACNGWPVPRRPAFQ